MSDYIIKPWDRERDSEDINLPWESEDDDDAWYSTHNIESAFVDGWLGEFGQVDYPPVELKVVRERDIYLIIVNDELGFNVSWCSTLKTAVSACKELLQLYNEAKGGANTQWIKSDRYWYNTRFISKLSIEGEKDKQFLRIESEEDVYEWRIYNRRDKIETDLQRGEPVVTVS